jgi:ABC-2 type transport system ATP-binding protein
MNVIEVENLTKVFKSHVKQEGLLNSFRSLYRREFKEYTAVDNVSFTIEQGKTVGMLGANGAGKTTVLKMLSGLLYPTSGAARVLGFTPWEREQEFKRNFSIVMGQRSQLWWDLPAADSFLLNKEIYNIPGAEFLKRRDRLAEKLDVADKLHVQVRRLSLGERMKCELIGALLHSPKVIYLDEPTIGLDVVAQHSLREFIKEFNRENDTTIILTSHYMEDIEELCERVILIADGKILYDGGLPGLVNEYATDKLLKVNFKEAVPREELEKFGTVTLFENNVVAIRIPRTHAPQITADILNRFPVEDVTIEEVPIEDIIRVIFKR